MILLKTPEGRAMTAQLTTVHAASSYGRLVLVLADGRALGPSDVEAAGLRVMTATDRERIALEGLGYACDSTATIG